MGILDHMEGKLTVSAGEIRAKTLEAMKRDVSTPETFKTKTLEIRGERNSCLLTGATGLLGLHMLPELCGRFGTVYVLVRRKSSMSAATYFEQQRKLYRIPEFGNVRVVEGDLEAELVGLSSNLERIQKNVSEVYHVGAKVNHVLGYNSMNKANVGGTRELLKIAFSTTPYMKFHYVSTINTLGPKQYGAGELGPSETLPVAEEMVDYQSGYAQSKWAGEQLVHRASQQGLQTTVHRCGMICWSSETGAGNCLNRDMRLLATVLYSGAAPTSNNRWNLLPADHATRIITSFCSQSEGGEVFHIVNPNTPVSYSDLLSADRWARAGVELDTVSHQEWFSRICALNPPTDSKARVINAAIREGYRNQLPGESGKHAVDSRLAAFASSIPNPADSVHLAARFLQGQDAASASREL